MSISDEYILNEILVLRENVYRLQADRQHDIQSLALIIYCLFVGYAIWKRKREAK